MREFGARRTCRSSSAPPPRSAEGSSRAPARSARTSRLQPSPSCPAAVRGRLHRGERIGIRFRLLLEIHFADRVRLPDLGELVCKRRTAKRRVERNQLANRGRDLRSSCASFETSSPPMLWPTMSILPSANPGRYRRERRFDVAAHIGARTANGSDGKSLPTAKTSNRRRIPAPKRRGCGERPRSGRHKRLEVVPAGPEQIHSAARGEQAMDEEHRRPSEADESRGASVIGLRDDNFAIRSTLGKSTARWASRTKHRRREIVDVGVAGDIRLHRRLQRSMRRQHADAVGDSPSSASPTRIVAGLSGFRPSMTMRMRPPPRPPPFGWYHPDSPSVTAPTSDSMAVRDRCWSPRG